MGNKTFDFSSKKKDCLPKKPKFGPNLAFPFIAGSLGALLVGWLVVVAWAVSRKTPIYFILFSKSPTKFCPNLAFLCIAGSFGGLLVGRLVVVARGLYLARHLFTLLYKSETVSFINLNFYYSLCCFFTTNRIHLVTLSRFETAVGARIDSTKSI